MAQDDNIRRWAMYAVIGFNLTVILLMIICSFVRGGMSALHLIDFIVTIVLALAVGGGVFWGSKNLNL
jgi:uncharacterized membrane protein YcaP (DUF421 family)